jgi:hypothetical protein
MVEGLIFAGIVVIGCVLSAFVGGWIHHRGVLAGRGDNLQFMGEAKGDVFRVEIPGEMGEDDTDTTDPNIERVLARAKAFTERMGA